MQGGWKRSRAGGKGEEGVILRDLERSRWLPVNSRNGGGGVEGWLTTDRLFSRRQRMPPPIISLPITGVGCMIFRLFLMVEA